jgi:N-acetylglutamate synthase-like GNAT family acetyltransferase
LNKGNGMLVRTATEGDCGVVQNLLKYLNPEDSEISEVEFRSLFSQILKSDSFIITVAELHNSVVGTCYLNIIPNLTRSASSYAVIENVVSHPDIRRQGIGSALISNALEIAKGKGCYKVMLLTGRDKEVQKFYESCGMESGTKTAFIVRFDK